MTHVLIVEDHEENRSLLKMLLEANGYRVTAACDGLEALAAARRDPPDAIVSDVLMPKMDGFELCRQWMQDASFKAIPFIFYSATYVRPENERFAMALGAVRYLIKPLEAEVFLRELRAVLQQWAGQSAPAPAAPLDDATSLALHESAMARKLEDKMAQLEEANRRLRESEARFRSLTEMSSDFYWESDAGHRLSQRTSADKTPSTVSAFERGEQIGERRWEIPYLSPDAAGWAAHRAVLDAHQPFREFELSRLGTDDTERFISISGDPVFDDSGEFTGYRGVGADITERKRAERALRESETRYRSLFESMLNGFAYCRMEYDDRDRPVDFVYLSVNDAFERLTGLKDVVRRKVSEVIPGIRELSPELFAIYGRVASTGIPETFEFDFKSMAKWLTISVYSPATGYFVAIFDDITERKRAEASLRESEQALRAIFDGALDGILVADVDTRKVLTANAAICRMLGYTHEEIIGISVSDIHPKQDLPRAMEQFENQVRGKIQMGAIIPMIRKDGSVFFAEIKAAPIRLDGKECLLGIFRDITERKAAEAEIQRLTQLYAALSQCNQAIVRCASEEELFPQVCLTAVQFGGMKMAWIGILDPDTRMVRSAARFGDHADEYLQRIEISADGDNPLGHGPAGTAIRENRPIWCQDFQNDPLIAPWQESGARFGWGAMASLPLLRNAVPIGVLTLYAGEVGAFDAAARHLLVEMATDISFALDNFAREAARERAEKDLRAAEQQFRGLVEHSIAGVYIVQDGKFAYVNRRYAEIFGYGSADELIGRDISTIVAEKDRGTMADHIRRRIDGEIETINYDFAGLRKDGSMIDVGVHGARATHIGRPAVVGMIQDISEKKRADEEIRRHVAQLETAFMTTVQVATTLGEMRDPYTAGHQRRVAEIAVAIGAELGFDARRQEGLRVAGYLHDVGKVRIPSEILSKPGKLTSVELQLVKGHAQASYDVLKDVKFPWPVAEVALQHHERIDGSGYPQGLKGEAIRLEARIIAVADVIEAMSSHRPYRAGLGIEAALSEIERGRGSIYDAEAADASLRLFRESRYQLPA